MDILQHLLSVIYLTALDYAPKDTYKLAAYSYDRLFLFQRILRPLRIILMQLSEFLVRSQKRYHTFKDNFPQSGTSTLADCCLPFMLAGAVLLEIQPSQLDDLLR